MANSTVVGTTVFKHCKGQEEEEEEEEEAENLQNYQQLTAEDAAVTEL
ncbi:hypothetical protein T4B_1514 [Trichinella pseudospiralis]|uniref:Uncharacterized protein n=1 Tax=Trichinella pseudospiralis TaxID=6337 RepID=A0A0V1IYT8_TRIPS|nr:hypothetical protein T4B_1514 [Trichinella pseudospiralis]KRZ43201.1 hypothetical protein T4C_8303 [Trichinella pseudospiralis]